MPQNLLHKEPTIKRFLTILLVLFGVLALALAAIWWKLPSLVEWGVVRTLEQQGLSNVSADFTYISRNQTKIATLGGTYAEPEARLDLNLSNVRLEYSFMQLLAGKLDSLAVDQAQLSIDYHPATEPESPAALPSMDLLLALYQAVNPAAIPIDSVTLDELSITHNLAERSKLAPSQVENLELRASLVKSADSLETNIFTSQGKLQWKISPSGGWDIRYYNQPTESARSMLTEAALNTSHPAFQGQLHAEDNALKFSAQLTTTFITELLAWADFPEPEFSFDFSDLRIRGQLSEASAKIDGDAEPKTETTPRLSLQSTLHASNAQIDSTALQSINLDVDTHFGYAQRSEGQSSDVLDIGYAVEATIGEIKLAEWQLSQVAFSSDGELDIELTDASEATNHQYAINRLDITASEVSQLSATNGGQQDDEILLTGARLSGSLYAAQQETTEGSLWQVEVGEGLAVTGKTAALASKDSATSLPAGFSFRLSTLPRLSINMQGDSLAASIEKFGLAVDVPVIDDSALPEPIEIKNARLSLSSVQWVNGAASAQGRLSIPRLALLDYNKATADAGSNTIGVVLSNIQQNFKFDKSVLTAQGSLQDAVRELNIDTSTRHNLNKQKGQTQFNLQDIAFADTKRLSKLVAQTPLADQPMPIQLVTGVLGLSGLARWQKTRDEWRVQLESDVRLKDIGGAYEEIFFSGTNGELSLELYPKLRSKSAHQVSIDTIDLGVVATNTRLVFALSDSSRGNLPQVSINAANTETLQGGLSLIPATYDLNLDSYRLTIQLENIDLNELVSLQQLEDIQATGRISGRLPLIIEGGQFSIDHGEMQANAPGGTLKYLADKDAVKANQYADTVVKILENFNYDVLHADTQYSPDGTLLLNLRLQGNNPDFEGGRAVNLNVNLEQNVLKLFESLRLIEGVNDSLEKRVQDHYQKSRSQKP